MNNSQMLKGVLEGCVLLVVAKQEIYGYELVQQMKQLGFTEIVGGTIYPILQKLEKKQALKSEMKASPDGPNRKYYKLTPYGRELIRSFIADWGQLEQTVAQFIHLKEEYIHEEK